MITTTPLERELMDLAMLPILSSNTRIHLIGRIKEGNLAQFENNKNHVCVSLFLSREEEGVTKLLIGFNSETNQYMFPQAHVGEKKSESRAERCIETLKRALVDQFGITLAPDFSTNPIWITKSQIHGSVCKAHLDVWYALPVEDDTDTPTGFDHVLWKPVNELPRYLADQASIEALNAFVRR